MSAVWWLPLSAFLILAALEFAGRPARRAHGTPAARADHALNLAGLLVQGAAIPAAGYAIATTLAHFYPAHAAVLQVGWWGAFLLNFVVIDFLYYWQHRLFHRVPALWALHQCHHAATRVTIWTAARNCLWINFLFVYLLVSPVLAFLCDSPEGFFAAAALTAALDLWRHSRLPERYAPTALSTVLITPPQHHLHHSPEGQHRNFGANLSLWDRLFGTYAPAQRYPAQYGTPSPPSAWRQFLYPW